MKKFGENKIYLYFCSQIGIRTLAAIDMKHLMIVAVMLLCITPMYADDSYKTSPEYLALRDSMHHAFNSGDSLRFYPALKNLQDYLLKQNDLHAYYTQRCNEIVFQINRQRIFEAYKLASQLSKELRERQLDSEMYMAYNMLGHLNRYCGNKDAAKDCFYKVIDMMEKYGYYESMPPIYMNLVNVEIDDDPAEAERLLDKAAEIAAQYSPERVFDIQTRKALSYFNGGDIPKFLEAYKQYREGVKQGNSSVHGRSMEVYYEACMGNVDKAVDIARKELGDDGRDAITIIYERAGRWQEAYKSLKDATASADSVNNVLLSNSMQNYRDELRFYNIEREAARIRTITLAAIIVLLLLLVLALSYIVFSRRRHMRELKRAYEHALESDKMKTAFIQNMTHEVRTPLNVISGFAQVLANPELSKDESRRKEMAKLMLNNTRIITNQIEEILELSENEASGQASREDQVNVNDMLAKMVRDNETYVSPGVTLQLDSSLDSDFTIMTNRNMLTRMVNALLDNAIKNTQKGSISLQASADDSNLILSVQDSGSGIPADQAEHIFERFVKLDTFKSGLGLGLPLCRIIANRLCGSIRLDADYKDGARFVVTLPL